MRVLAYISGYDGCGYYRVQLPAKFLNKVEDFHFKISTQYLNKDIDWADIIVLQKQTNQKALPFIQYAKSKGKKIITEVDDSYFNIPTWNPAYKHYVGKEQDLINFYSMSDAITVTTPHLAKELSKYNQNTYVIPNSLDVSMLDRFKNTKESELNKYTQYLSVDQNNLTLEEAKSRMDGKIILGWGGSPTHLRDLDLVTEALIKLTSENKDTMLVMMACTTDTLLKKINPDQLLLIKPVPIFMYPQVLASMPWNIGICPIEDNVFNRSKCVIKGTLVQTPDGVLPIDKLSSFREENKIDTFAKGLIKTDLGFENFDGFYYGGKQKCLKITTECGYTISGTETHKIKLKEWVELKDVKIGDTLEIYPIENTVEKYVEVNYPLFMHKLYSEDCLKTYNKSSPRVTIDEDWGRFLGYMIGDGTISAINCMGISCSTDYLDIIDDVQRLIRGFGLHPFIVEKKDKRVLDSEGNIKIGKGRDVKFTSGIMVRFLRHLGVSGRKQKILEVPDVIFKSPLPVVREFLRGLFESDSYTVKSNACCKLVSKNRKLIEQVQILLLMFGIKSKLVIFKGRSQNWTEYKNYYQCVLNSKSSRIFLEKIGYISEVKQRILKERCSKTKSNSFEDWSFTEKISSIELFEEDVFDICVPTLKRYWANGFLSHNSNLKFLEFAINDIPCVCSNVENYAKTITHGVDGLLADNTTASWYSNLKKLVDDIDFRKSIAKNGEELVRTKFAMSANYKKWEEVYKDILNENI